MKKNKNTSVKATTSSTEKDTITAAKDLVIDVANLNAEPTQNVAPAKTEAAPQVPAQEGKTAPAPAKNALTADQVEALKRYEQIIGTGLGSFYDIGKALKGIKEEGLWKASHKTFDQYPPEVWDMSRSYAYRLIHAAELVDKLKSVTGKNAFKRLPINESQVRPIVEEERIDARSWVAIWRQVVEEAKEGAITAALVASVVRERVGEKPKPKANDKDVEPREGGEDAAATNDRVVKIRQLVNEARTKKDGLTPDYYKQVLDQIWEQLEQLTGTE